MSEGQKRGFAWSKSRERAFETCFRQYYYQYYGHAGGWDPRADAETREIWRLRNLTNRYMWIGSLVHEVAERVLRFVHVHGEAPSESDMLRRFDRRMRAGFRDSRDDVGRARGSDATRLFEHEFDERVSDGVWKEAHSTGKQAIRNLYASPIFGVLLRLPRASWLVIEGMDGAEIDGVPIRVKLDAAYTDAHGVRILDWKTGRRAAEPAELQLAAYALYAREKWGTPAAEIRTSEVNLVRNEVTDHAVTETALDRARRHIVRSAAAMRAKLEDPEADVARPDAFGKVEQIPICKRCAFQRVCLGGLATEVLGARKKAGPANAGPASMHSI